VDNLTHALVGLAISKAGAERATPLATATLVLAANAPDIDVASYVGGPYFALAFRRGITHGWPALVVLPLLVVVVVLAWDRSVRRRRDPDCEPARAGPLLALSAIGVLTHPTLDWMNTYGMRWGLPFDGAWSYGDALFIIDPWIWLTLGGSIFLASRPSGRDLAAWAALALAATALVVTALLSARILWLVGIAAIVSLRISGRPDAAAGRRALVRVAGVAVCVYATALVVADGLARRDVVAEGARAGLDVRDVMIAPLLGNPFISEVEVRTANSYVPGTHAWLRSRRVELRPGAAVPLLVAPTELSGPAMERVLLAARSEPSARHYLVWSRFPYARVEPDGDGWQVTFADARYDGVREAGSLGSVSVRIPREPARD
jgi:inner membrane protein